MKSAYDHHRAPVTRPPRTSANVLAGLATLLIVATGLLLVVALLTGILS